MKVLISTNDVLVKNLFENYGYKTTFGYTDSFDLVCFTGGGADVSPFYYGETAIRETHSSIARDVMEVGLWKSLPSKFPKLGICRGMQLGNVLCGGKLWQDVNNHEDGYHPIELKYGESTGKTKVVNTLHHQQVIPTSDAVVLANAFISSRRKNQHLMYTKASSAGPWPDDVEAVYYSNFNFMGVQWHPEYEHESSENVFMDFFWSLYPNLTQEYVPSVACSEA